MTTVTAVALTCLLCAGYLMWTGSAEISTQTITARVRRRHSWIVWEYTLTHPLVPYLGWIKLAWSVPLLIIGIQILLNTHPTLIDLALPHLRQLLKTSDKNISGGILVISVGIIFVPSMLASMFGESERIR